MSAYPKDRAALLEMWPMCASREAWAAYLADEDYAADADATISEGCHEGAARCKHLDGRWCALHDLPASVNPILTPRTGMPGMACMGAGFEADLFSASAGVRGAGGGGEANP